MPVRQVLWESLKPQALWENLQPQALWETLQPPILWENLSQQALWETTSFVGMLVHKGLGVELLRITSVQPFILPQSSLI